MFFAPLVAPVAVTSPVTVSAPQTQSPAAQPPPPASTPTPASTPASTPAKPPIDPETGQPVAPRDPTTGQVILPRDETGQLIIPKDETGQPLILRDETGQYVPMDEDDVAAARESGLSSRFGGGLDEIGGGRPRDGGATHHLRLTLAEGFNSNVFQTQAVAGGPVTQHPSLFTGADASIDLQSWMRSNDPFSLRLNFRGQHYTPLDGATVRDDGTASGAISAGFTLGPSTTLRTGLLATLTSANSALVSDGALLLVDPTGTQDVYTIEDVQLGLVHELSPRWRLNFALDEFVEATVQAPPLVLANGSTISQNGRFGSLVTIASAALRHDFDPYNLGALEATYTPSVVPTVVDYTRTPPLYLGSEFTQSGGLALTWIHSFGASWRSQLGAGASLAESPPLDSPPNTGPIFTPVGNGVLSYAKRDFIAQVSASYSYGSTAPILGFGPTASAGFLAQGIPYPHGRWTQLAILASGSGARSQLLVNGGGYSVLEFAVATAEARLAVNTWLGLVAGYNFRYSATEGLTAIPSLVRHVMFLGVGGYFADDKSLPTVDMFAAPVVPSG